MRTDRRHAASHIVDPCRPQRREQSGASPLRFVAQLDRRRYAGELFVGLLHHRGDPRHERRSGVSELIGDLGELRVPHVEGHLDLSREFARPRATGLLRLFEQCVALLDDAIDLETNRVVLRGERDQRVVHEPASVARPTLHDDQVVGREHGHPDRPEQIADPLQLLLVDLHPVAPDGVQLGFDQRVSRPSSWCTVARMIAWSAPTRTSASPGAPRKLVNVAKIGERLGEVRLALSVVADDHRRPRRQIELRGHVVPEVDELQMRDDQDQETTKPTSATSGNDARRQTQPNVTTRVRRRHALTPVSAANGGANPVERTRWGREDHGTRTGISRYR